MADSPRGLVYWSSFRNLRPALAAGNRRRSAMMELPDEAIDYHFQGLIAPPAGGDYSPLAELQNQHFLALSRLRAILPLVNQVRGQVAAERELMNPAAELKPLDAGFIDCPQRLLEQHR